MHALDRSAGPSRAADTRSGRQRDMFILVLAVLAFFRKRYPLVPLAVLARALVQRAQSQPRVVVLERARRRAEQFRAGGRSRRAGDGRHGAVRFELGLERGVLALGEREGGRRRQVRAARGVQSARRSGVSVRRVEKERRERKESGNALGADLGDVADALVRVAVREQVRVLVRERGDVRFGERVPACELVDLGWSGPGV